MWQNLWSHARIDLGLSKREFLTSSPRHLDGFTKRHQQRVECNEFLVAQLTACVVNFSMCRPKESVETKDFMPSEMRRRTQEHLHGRKKRINRQHVLEETRKFMAELRANQKVM